MRYEILDSTGEVITWRKSEAKAVEEAKNRNAYGVVAHEKSGTYESYTNVWPERGPTYTN